MKYCTKKSSKRNQRVTHILLGSHQSQAQTLLLQHFIVCFLFSLDSMSFNPQQLLRLTLYDCLQIPLPLCPLTLCSLHILQPTITSQTFRFPYLYVPSCYVPHPQFFPQFISPLTSPVNFCLKRQKKRNFLTNIISFSCCFLGLMFTGNQGLTTMTHNTVMN